ncbi:unnamed protein product [Boreogadus saida]
MRILVTGTAADGPPPTPPTQMIDGAGSQMKCFTWSRSDRPLVAGHINFIKASFCKNVRPHQWNGGHTHSERRALLRTEQGQPEQRLGPIRLKPHLSSAAINTQTGGHKADERKMKMKKKLTGLIRTLISGGAEAHHPFGGQDPSSLFYLEPDPGLRQGEPGTLIYSQEEAQDRATPYPSLPLLRQARLTQSRVLQQRLDGAEEQGLGGVKVFLLKGTRVKRRQKWVLH